MTRAGKLSELQSSHLQHVGDQGQEVAEEEDDHHAHWAQGGGKPQHQDRAQQEYKTLSR